MRQTRFKIYQVELTNYCNARCSYCPHSKMTRKKGYMDVSTFERVLQVADNRYFALHHFGEPFLHPQLPLFIEMANAKGFKVEFSTNGGVNDPDRIKAVLEAEPYLMRVAIDYFDPIDFILKALSVNQRTIITAHSVSGDPRLLTRKPFCNFAGAVPGRSEIAGECYFKKYKFAVVLWDGRVVPCCVDYDGREIIGDVFNGVTFKEDYEICKDCLGMQFAQGGLWHEDV